MKGECVACIISKFMQKALAMSNYRFTQKTLFLFFLKYTPSNRWKQIIVSDWIWLMNNSECAERNLLYVERVWECMTEWLKWDRVWDKYIYTGWPTTYASVFIREYIEIFNFFFLHTYTGSLGSHYKNIFDYTGWSKKKIHIKVVFF